MELILNKKTYTLKNINSERRFYVMENLLSLYQDNIEKNKKFFKLFTHNIKKSIWKFLKDDDKKEIKTFKKLKITKESSIKFINFVSNKIIEYCNYVQNIRGDGTQKLDVEEIYAFLAKQNGWTKDYIKEMDELDLLKSVNEAIEIKRREKLEKINNESLVAAYSRGSEQAKRRIDELNKKYEFDVKMSEFKNSKIHNNLIFTEQELNKNA